MLAVTNPQPYRFIKKALTRSKGLFYTYLSRFTLKSKQTWKLCKIFTHYAFFIVKKYDFHSIIDMRNYTTRWLSLVAPIVIASQTLTAKPLPNIVVFLVDDLGYMDIGANNPECFYETPHIDALAKSGMRFTNGYAANPVCSPTRYSLLTGKYPTRAGVTNFFPKSAKKIRSGKFHPAPLVVDMPMDEITLADALKTKGYKTFFAGKWHLGHDESNYPDKRGFDINIGGNKAGGPYTGKKYFAPYKNPQIEKEGPKGEHLPARLAQETSDFITANKDQPFFAYLSFYSVHAPLIGRPDLVKKYKEKAKTITGTEWGKEQGYGDAKRQVRILQKHPVYAAMVEATDLAVGEVLETIDSLGLTDDTIIIFTSDNGGLSTVGVSPTSNLPLRGGKGWIYEGGIREPWIIRYPKLTKAGEVNHEPICSIDLFPTAVKAAGVDIEHNIDGLDLTPLLGGGTLDRKALFWHYPHYSNQGGIPGGAIRIGDYKLIERYEDGSVHLYDLNKDLAEQNDISSQHPQLVTSMRKQLHSWYQETGAKFLQEKNGLKPWRPSYLKEKSE